MNPVILEVAEGFLQGGGYATPLHFLGEMLLAERKWLGNFVHISLHYLVMVFYSWSLWYLMLLYAEFWWFIVLYDYNHINMYLYVYIYVFKYLYMYNIIVVHWLNLKSPALRGVQVHMGVNGFLLDPSICFPAKKSWLMRFQSLGMVGNLIRTIFIEGSLEVKLPTIWTVEKQRWDESEETRSEERRGRCAKR